MDLYRRETVKIQGGKNYMAGRGNNNGNKSGKESPADNLSKKFFSKLTGYNTTTVPPGKGARKKKITDKELYGIKGFFRVYKDQFWNLIIVNMLFMLFMLPAICGVLSFSGTFGTRIPTPSNILYAPVYGMHLCHPTPATSALVGIYGAQGVITAGNTATAVMNIIALGTFLTFGFANAGMTYILRAYTRREFSYVWHDYFATIKKNFFGALALGIADLAMIILLGMSALFYYTSPPDITNTLMFFISFSMCVIYFMMRFYLYILLITFKLSPIKLVKNAFILTLLGIKRNFAALFGILGLCLLNVGVFMVSIPFGITLPFFFLVGNGAFMAVFAAYANVKKFIIDPYMAEQAEKTDKNGKIKIEEEPIFIDRG